MKEITWDLPFSMNIRHLTWQVYSLTSMFCKWHNPMLLNSLHSVLLRVSIAVTKHYDHKQLVEERVYFSIQFSLHTQFLGELWTGTEQGKNRVRRGWKGHEGVMLTHQGSLSLLSYSTQWHHHRGGTAYSEVGPHISIINEENAPQACLWVNLVAAFSEWKFPLPKWLWFVTS